MPGLLGFTLLAERLVHHARERIRRGDLSEASLAGLIGYSQPHIHNVLKGKRGLSFALADDLLALSDVPLAALFSQEERADPSPRSDSESLPVTLLRGHLGAGAPYPVFPDLILINTVKIPRMKGVINPLALRISPHEASMRPLIQPHDTIAIDTAPNERRHPNPACIYAICWDNRGYLGRCRLRPGRLDIRVDNPGPASLPPSSIRLDRGTRLLDVVRGKVIWLSRLMGSESKRPWP